MRALCEMPYVHSPQMRKLAFRNEMPQKGDGWCWKTSKKPEPPSRSLTPRKSFRDGGSLESDSK